MRVALAFLSVFACSLASSSQTLDQQSVANLRQRGLYRLANLECQQRIESRSLSDRERVDLTIEWSRVSVAQAFDSPAATRDAHWQAAREKLDRLAQSPNQPFKILLDLQATLNLLEQHELERIERLGRGDAQQLLPRLREAIGDLDALATDIERRRRELATGVLRESDLSEQQLAALDRHVSLALAQAYAEQGLVYPAGSVDRINALQQAIESLQPLANTSPVDDLAWNARLALARCQTYLGQADAALSLIAKWKLESPPQQYEAELLAVQIRAMSHAGRSLEAMPSGADQSHPPGSSPAVDLARLEALLAAAQPDANRVEQLLGLIRNSHSPKYVREAEALVGRTFASAGQAATSAAQTHAAEHFYRAGDPAAAIAAYDQAAELGRKEGNRTAAFAAERSAAAVAQQQRDFKNAAARFRRLALGSLDQAESAGDHREAVLCLAAVAQQAVSSDPPSAAQAYAEYLDLCREHLRHWSAGPTAGEVQWWLGRALAARSQWPTAIETLKTIEPSSPHYSDSIQVLATAYRHAVQSQSNTSQRRQLVAEATQHLQAAILGEDNQWPTKWTSSQRVCAVELARMQLGAGGASYAERMLHAALGGKPAAEKAYREMAVPLLAMSLVMQKKTAEAVATLRQGAGSQSLAGLADRLVTQLVEQTADQQKDASPSSEQAALGQLLLATLDLAGDDAEQWETPTMRYRAAALAAIGNTAEAQTYYAALIKQFPRNGQLQQEFAQVLSRGSTSEDLEQALAAWGRVESGSRRGGPRWQQARQARIHTLTRLGRQQEADKLEKLTNLLYPK